MATPFTPCLSKEHDQNTLQIQCEQGQNMTIDLFIHFLEKGAGMVIVALLPFARVEGMTMTTFIAYFWECEGSDHGDAFDLGTKRNAE